MEPQNTRNTQTGIGEGRGDLLSNELTVDLLVEHIVPVQRKVAKPIDEVHRARCVNCLKATGSHLCLLLNFGKPRPEINRTVPDP